MKFMSLVLYLHVLAALLLAAVFSIEALILTRLRRAATLSETDLWLTLIPPVPFMAAGALLVLLLSGGFLTARMDIWTLGWPRVAVCGTVLVAILCAATGRLRPAIR